MKNSGVTVLSSLNCWSPEPFLGGKITAIPAKHTLTELKPDIAVVAAGNASLDVGGSILMAMDEVVAFARTAPDKVIANHLEALNHCPTTREELKTVFAENGLSSRAFIPDDGETLEFST